MRNGIEDFLYAIENWNTERYQCLKQFLLTFDNSKADLLPTLLQKFKELDEKFQEIEDILEKFEDGI